MGAHHKHQCIHICEYALFNLLNILQMNFYLIMKDSNLILMTLYDLHLQTRPSVKRLVIFFSGIKVFLNACHQVIKLQLYVYIYGRVRKLLCSQVVNYGTKAKCTLFVLRHNKKKKKKKKKVVPCNSFYKTIPSWHIKNVIAKFPHFQTQRLQNGINLQRGLWSFNSSESMIISNWT